MLTERVLVSLVRAGALAIVDVARGRRLGFRDGSAVVQAMPVLLLLAGVYRAKQGVLLVLLNHSHVVLHDWIDGVRWRPTVAGDGVAGGDGEEGRRVRAPRPDLERP